MLIIVTVFFLYIFFLGYESSSEEGDSEEEYIDLSDLSNSDLKFDTYDKDNRTDYDNDLENMNTKHVEKKLNKFPEDVHEIDKLKESINNRKTDSIERNNITSPIEIGTKARYFLWYLFILH